jgi:hypothetical protein
MPPDTLPPTVAARVRLSPLEFKRQMLADMLTDLQNARTAQSFTAITNLTRSVNALRDEIADHETEEATAAADPLEGKTVEELIAEQCAAIEDPDFPPHLLEPLVQALARRLGPAAMERICRPVLRVVDG